MGKDWTVDSTLSNGRIPALWKQYKEQFNLDNVKFYVRIAPVDLASHNKVLKTYAEINAVDGTDGICKKTRYNGSSFVTSNYSCPVHTSDSNHKLILTHPRLINPDNASLRRFITPDLTIVGNEDIGFEIKVMLKYKRNDQDFSCEAMHTFTHSTKSFTGTMTDNVSVTVDSLVSGASANLLDTSRKKTSCDTDGSGYKNVTIQLNFSGFSGASPFVGNMFFCQGVSACRSGSDNSSYESCRVEVSPWQRCHNFKFPGQASATDALLLANDQLKLTFNNLQDNRRYDLYFTEVSFLETPLKRRIARFYIDAKRPVIGGQNIVDDDVGQPEDGTAGRNYSGSDTSWSKPPDSKDDKWLQCNTSDVDFTANITDQFTHNLKECDFTSSRRDGNGISNTTSSITNKSYHTTDYGGLCRATLGSINHGRQTIVIAPSDTCGGGSGGNLVWDTDLPSSFSTQDFPSDPFWFRSIQKIAYPIDTVLPAANTAGRFPKHYSVDCFQNQFCEQVRQDGDGGTISCQFTTHDSPSDHDGCNPMAVDMKYHHVCGGIGDEDSRWAVYAPVTKSCQNVQCEPGLICCDSGTNEDNRCTLNRCYENNYSRTCSDPKGGSNQDSSSGCPPLGLYTCAYLLPCNGTSPFSQIGSNSYCSGKRQNNSCRFQANGTCTPNAGVGIHESRPSSAGTCSFSGTSWTKSCTASVSEFCDSGHHVTRKRCVREKKTVCRDECCEWKREGSDPDDTDPRCTPGGPGCTCVRNCPRCVEEWDDCAREESYTEWVCDDYDYRVSSTDCSQTVSGTCGVPSGGCSPKGVGGGNLSQERCSVDRPSVCGTPCDSSARCCPGDSYPSNSNCACNSSTTCCSGDSYPSNPHCACNLSTTCCPGDSYPAQSPLRL